MIILSVLVEVVGTCTLSSHDPYFHFEILPPIEYNNDGVYHSCMYFLDDQEVKVILESVDDTEFGK